MRPLAYRVWCAMKAGEGDTSVTLANAVGESREPVYDAIRHLITRGLVERVPGTPRAERRFRLIPGATEPRLGPGPLRYQLWLIIAARDGITFDELVEESKTPAEAVRKAVDRMRRAEGIEMAYDGSTGFRRLIKAIPARCVDPTGRVRDVDPEVARVDKQIRRPKSPVLPTELHPLDAAWKWPKRIEAGD